MRSTSGAAMPARGSPPAASSPATAARRWAGSISPYGRRKHCSKPMISSSARASTKKLPPPPSVARTDCRCRQQQICGRVRHLDGKNPGPRSRQRCHQAWQRGRRVAHGGVLATSGDDPGASSSSCPTNATRPSSRRKSVPQSGEHRRYFALRADRNCHVALFRILDRPQDGRFDEQHAQQPIGHPGARAVSVPPPPPARRGRRARPRPASAAAPCTPGPRARRPRPGTPRPWLCPWRGSLRPRPCASLSRAELSASPAACFTCELARSSAMFTPCSAVTTSFWMSAMAVSRTSFWRSPCAACCTS